MHMFLENTLRNCYIYANKAHSGISKRKKGDSASI